MLAVNYKNLLTRIYPETPKVFNLETAAYFYFATVANVSVVTFFVNKGSDVISSSYIVGIEVDNLSDIPYVELNGRKVTSPIKTLQDLFTYEEFVDPQVTFDYVSWFEASQKLDPLQFLEPQHHDDVKGILREGWSHGNR